MHAGADQPFEFLHSVAGGGLLDQPVEAWQSVMVAGETYESWLSERQEQQHAAEMSNALWRSTVGLG